MSSHPRTLGLGLSTLVLLPACAVSKADHLAYFSDAGESSLPGNYAPPSDEDGLSGYPSADSGTASQGADAGNTHDTLDASEPDVDASTSPEQDAGHASEPDAGQVAHGKHQVDGILNPGEWDDGTWQEQSVAS